MVRELKRHQHIIEYCVNRIRPKTTFTDSVISAYPLVPEP